MSEQSPTYREYYEQVRGIADGVAEALRDEGDTGHAMCRSRFCVGVDPSDLIHERIDSHAWMIYYHYQGAVMEHTDNPTYLTDAIGADALQGVTGWYDVRQAFAFWAFRADVEASYWDRFDDRGDRVQADNSAVTA